MKELKCVVSCVLCLSQCICMYMHIPYSQVICTCKTMNPVDQSSI